MKNCDALKVKQLEPPAYLERRFINKEKRGNIPFEKPSMQDVYALLKEQNSLIVHFSGSPKGQGEVRSNNGYPNDLKTVLNERAMGGLSCSTVKPAYSHQISHRLAFEKSHPSAF